jgi:hypothetical protein
VKEDEMGREYGKSEIENGCIYITGKIWENQKDRDH